jgi:hypothetical protein
LREVERNDDFFTAATAGVARLIRKRLVTHRKLDRADGSKIPRRQENNA